MQKFSAKQSDKPKSFDVKTLLFAGSLGLISCVSTEINSPNSLSQWLPKGTSCAYPYHLIYPTYIEPKNYPTSLDAIPENKKQKRLVKLGFVNPQRITKNNCTNINIEKYTIKNSFLPNRAPDERVSSKHIFIIHKPVQDLQYVPVKNWNYWHQIQSMLTAQLSGAGCHTRHSGIVSHVRKLDSQHVRITFTNEYAPYEFAVPENFDNGYWNIMFKRGNSAHWINADQYEYTTSQVTNLVATSNIENRSISLMAGKINLTTFPFPHLS